MTMHLQIFSFFFFMEKNINGWTNLIEPGQSISYKTVCAHSEDTGQPVHPH